MTAGLEGKGGKWKAKGEKAERGPVFAHASFDKAPSAKGDRAAKWPRLRSSRINEHRHTVPE